ncbi:hypothetical protein THRCLA_00171 [Thraustotheca clavata]|uniref:Uncharacterized protein n=1 Tax=Thraustotheca clavata TaxID=74557 RepID=A0A1W0AC25_9STRA|nr:hypothetical protein THRCLA_00171 [Thraustotheca clavata]
MVALYSSSVLTDEALAEIWVSAIHWSLGGFQYQSNGNEVPVWKPTVFIQRNELPYRFERHGIEPVPIVFDHILDVLVSKKEAITVAQFMEMCQRKSMLKWIVNTTMTTPLRWGMKSLWNALVGANSHSQHSIPYLSMPVLAALSSHVSGYVLQHHEVFDYTFCLGHTDCLEHEYSFLSLCRSASSTASCHVRRFLEELPPEELQWIAIHLVYTKKAAMTQSAIKFFGKDAKSIEVNECDNTMLLLNHTISKIEKALTTLQTEINTMQIKAIDSKKRGATKEAINFWRHVKLMQTELENRQNALLNLISTKHKLRTMHVNAWTVEGYKLATESLRITRDTLHLSVESVEEALSSWNEVVEEQTQIEEILSKDTMNSVDEEALKLELLSLSEPSESSVEVKEEEITLLPVAMQTEPVKATNEVTNKGTIEATYEATSSKKEKQIMMSK